MNRIQSIFGIAAVALVLTGCGDNGDKSIQNLSGEYQSRSVVTQEVKIFSQLEGKIVKVQPSSIQYIGRHLGPYGKQSTGNHEFEYVVVEQEGKLHTFIYPYSKAVLERDATIKFRALNSGVIDAQTFIDTFIKRGYWTDDNIIIEAEGLIVKDGIEYK